MFWEFDGVSPPNQIANLGSSILKTNSLISINGILYFATNSDLWEYNGTNTATTLMFTYGSNYDPNNLTEFNGKLYFGAKIGSNNRLFEYHTNSFTEIGSSYGFNLSEIEVANGILYIEDHGWSNILMYDGANITLLYTSGTAYFQPRVLTKFNGELYFLGEDVSGISKLWKIDNSNFAFSVSNPALSYGIYSFSSIKVIDGKLYFMEQGQGFSSFYLNEYDGNNLNTLANFNNFVDVDNLHLHKLHGNIYYIYNDFVNGEELWRYNGSSATMITDINPNSGSSTIQNLTTFNGKLYFTATNGNNEIELWQYAPNITFSNNACENDDELLVNITATNVTNDLGAISMVFDYDDAFMTYDASYLEQHPNLNVNQTTANTVINEVNGKIYISWASGNGTAATIANGDTLFTLRFTPASGSTFGAGTTGLDWDNTIAGNNELADGTQNVLTTTFTDSIATIHAAPIADLTNDATNHETCDGDVVLFTATGGDIYEFFVDNASQSPASATATFTDSTLTNGNVVSVIVTNGYGCTDDDATTMTVYDLPDVTLTSDDSDNEVCKNQTVTFTAGGTDDYIFKVDGTPQTPQSPSSTFAYTPNTVGTYVISVEGENTTTGCKDDSPTTFSINVSDCYTTSGEIVYKNTDETKMTNVAITMTNNDGTLISSTQTDQNGSFSIDDMVQNETYTFSATSTKGHGGINSTDALGIILEALNPLVNYFPAGSIEKKAADVDGASGINATDALLVMQRFAQVVNTFAIGDWVFEDKLPYSMTQDYIGEKIYALASGDVNGSYTNIPDNGGTSVFLTQNGNLSVTYGQTVQIPITVAQTAEMGAISLSVYFPSQYMTIQNVTLANGSPFIHNIQGDELRIAWAEATPMQLAAGDVVLTLEAIIHDAANVVNYPLGVNMDSEIANGQAIPYDVITLEAPILAFTTNTHTALASDINIRNYPNPFSTTSTIEYQLPQAGDVTLTVYNAIGQQVQTLVQETQQAGQHQVMVNAANWATGTYFYTILVQEENKSYTATKRMMIIGQ